MRLTGSLRHQKIASKGFSQEYLTCQTQRACRACAGNTHGGRLRTLAGVSGLTAPQEVGFASSGGVSSLIAPVSSCAGASGCPPGCFSALCFLALLPLAPDQASQQQPFQACARHTGVSELHRDCCTQSISKTATGNGAQSVLTLASADAGLGLGLQVGWQRHGVGLVVGPGHAHRLPLHPIGRAASR